MYTYHISISYRCEDLTTEANEYVTRASSMEVAIAKATENFHRSWRYSGEPTVMTVSSSLIEGKWLD